jgi:hypothetical protein
MNLSGFQVFILTETLKHIFQGYYLVIQTYTSGVNFINICAIFMGKIWRLFLANGVWQFEYRFGKF